MTHPIPAAADVSATPLDPGELTRLDALLAAAHPDDAMLPEVLDGFLAALGLLPEPVGADEWLPVVLGGRWR
jgi:yecA family protein